MTQTLAKCMQQTVSKINCNHVKHRSRKIRYANSQVDLTTVNQCTTLLFSYVVQTEIEHKINFI